MKLEPIGPAVFRALEHGKKSSGGAGGRRSKSPPSPASSTSTSSSSSTGGGGAKGQPGQVSRRSIISRAVTWTGAGGNRLDAVKDEEVWQDEGQLMKDCLQEIWGKFGQIDDEIWGKVVVMERNHRVAKAYLRAPQLTINGEDSGFDGHCIGLSAFGRHPEEMKKRISDGIRIRMDDSGNMQVKRLSKARVWVAGVEGHPAPIELERECSATIFDLRGYRDMVERELRSSCPDIGRMEAGTVVSLSFGQSSGTGGSKLKQPIWIMIFNVVGLHFLRSRLAMSGHGSTGSRHPTQSDQKSHKSQQPQPPQMPSLQQTPPALPPRHREVDPYYSGMSAKAVHHPQPLQPIQRQAQAQFVATNGRGPPDDFARGFHRVPSWSPASSQGPWEERLFPMPGLEKPRHQYAGELWD